MLQELIHFGFHLIVPGLIAWIFFRKNWKMAWLIMIATMVVDLDHLLADPIFLANRCSINFHPLHSYVAIGAYFIMTLFKQLRIVGVGLILHMITDFIDCSFMA